MRTRNLLVSMILASSLALGACSGEDYGKTVEQGRAVAFGGGTVTFVKDVNVNPKKGPSYENSIRTFSLPKDPKEIGPEPKVGCLIDFNVDKKQVQIYKDNELKTVAIETVNVQTNIESHNAAVKGKTFPMVNKDKNEVTIYGKKTLLTFKVPSSLPVEDAFWTMGDNVRVFSTEEGKARRFMNISKTNIFKK